MPVETILAVLIALLVGVALYAVFVPRKEYRSPNPPNRGKIADFTNSVTEELYSAMPFLIPKTRKTSKIDLLLKKAGNPWNVTSGEFWLITALSTLGGMVLGLLLWVFLNVMGIHTPWFLWVLGMGVFVGFLPFLSLRDDAQKREEEFRKELPQCLDLITISLAGGRTFTSALRESLPNMPEGVLREEFRQVLVALDTGKPLSEALGDFRERTPNDSVRVFVSAVMDAVSLDVDMKEILTKQSASSRQELKSYVDKKVATMPSRISAIMTPAVLGSILVVSTAPYLLKLLAILGM